MNSSSFKDLVAAQRQFFATGATRSLDFRMEQLKKLKALIHHHENEILDALKKDLNKSGMEAFTQEIMQVTEEIRFILKHLKKWAKPRKTGTPLTMWPGHSEIQFEPYGVVLVISAWNYPFQLTLSPVVGAIAAGNCVVIKPSELATHTETLLIKLFAQHFPANYLTVVHGDAEATQALLTEKFDYIFYTGGTRVGQIIMEAAAKQLTPVTLELGGKSPCIIDETADIDFAARRIIWGKTANAGQVCVAPDYLLVHESRKTELIEALKKTITRFFGEHPEKSDSYGRIINQKQFDRLVNLLATQNHIVFGGTTDAAQRYIAPTLIDDVTFDSPIMQEEIFGPILPILTYTHLDHAIQAIKQRPKPLALYLFTCDKNQEKHVLEQISFGGGCVNDCIMQVANVNLPFGGVGMSGMGQYHGQFSFETFSHRKGVYKRTLRLDFDFLYPPYTLKKLNLIRRLLRV